MADASEKVCDRCRREVDHVPSFICAECSNGLCLCIGCFSSQVTEENSEHLPNHSYHVRDNISAMKIFREDWSATEELALLDGILKYGLGNWKEVAITVATKSERMCEDHYYDDYLGVYGYFLPKSCYANALSPSETMLSEKVGGFEFLGETSSKERRRLDIAQEEQVRKVAKLDNTEHNLPLGPSSDPPVGTKYDREMIRDMPRATVQQIQDRICELPGADLNGYMPLRGDFDSEYDNGAEEILAEMDFSPTDLPADRALKLEVVKIYNAKLDERERRKKYVVDRGLLSYKEVQKEESKLPPDERDLVSRLRIFSRFQSREEHDELVSGVLEAKRIRKKIDQLQHYRRMGVRTITEGILYEKQMRQNPSDSLPVADSTTQYLAKLDHRSSSSQNGITSKAAEVSTGVLDRVWLAGAPGAEFLSKEEEELCVKIKLLPKYYLALKDSIVREAFAKGFLSKTEAHKLVRIDVERSGAVYDFIVCCGWIPDQAKEVPTNKKLEISS